KGVTWAVVPVFMSGFCPLMVFLASFANKRAYWKLTTLDYACGLFSAIALILWGITKKPDIAIVFAIASDGLAAVPTVRKTLSHPETETGIAYVLAGISAATSFAAVQNWTFAEYGFATYLVVLDVSLSLLIYGGKSKVDAAL